MSVRSSLLWPHLHLSFAAATTILVANTDTARRIPVFFRRKIRPMLETGVAPDQIIFRDAAAPSPGLKIVWVGRLEKIKAPALALHAFTEALKMEPSLRLDVVGGGPEEGPVKKLAAELKVGHAIQWHGKVPKARIPGLLGQGDIFLFTSVRDTSGNVLLEAMAAGLPAITLLHQGAAEIATDATAIRITPASFEQTAKEVGCAIAKLAHSSDLRTRLGTAARNRVLDVYTWDRKGEQMDAVYHDAVAPSRTALHPASI